MQFKRIIRKNRTGEVVIIGVIFKPFGLIPLLKCPVHEVSGQVWNVKELMGNHIHELEENLSSPSTIEQKMSKLEAWLLKAMNVNTSAEYEKRVQFTVNLIRMNKGLVQINEVLKHVNLTERSLERHFKYFTGLTHKICRIQHVLREMRMTEMDIANYAVKGGFYDQSHFHRIFKRLTGTTPLSYLQAETICRIYTIQYRMNDVTIIGSQRNRE